MAKTYIRKRVIVVKKTEGILSAKEMELVKKYDKKSYDDYMNYITNLKWLWLKRNPISDDEKERITALLPDTSITY